MGFFQRKKKKVGSAEIWDYFSCGLHNPLTQIQAQSHEAVQGKWLSTSWGLSSLSLCYTVSFPVWSFEQNLLSFSWRVKRLPQADYLQNDYRSKMWHPCPSPASLKIQTHTVLTPRSDQRENKLFLFLFGSLSPTYIKNTVTSTATEEFQDKSKLKGKKRKRKFL